MYAQSTLGIMFVFCPPVPPGAIIIDHRSFSSHDRILLSPTWRQKSTVQTNSIRNAASRLVNMSAGHFHLRYAKAAVSPEHPTPQN